MFVASLPLAVLPNGFAVLTNPTVNYILEVKSRNGIEEDKQVDA